MKRFFEIFITAATSAVILTAVMCMCGCNYYNSYITIETGDPVIDDIDDMANSQSLFTCLGGFERHRGGCDAKNYYGCVDCFGLTMSDDKKIEDYYGYANGCDSCTYVQFPIFNIPEQKILPVYGCYVG